MHQLLDRRIILGVRPRVPHPGVSQLWSGPNAVSERMELHVWAADLVEMKVVDDLLEALLDGEFELVSDEGGHGHRGLQGTLPTVVLG